MAFANGELTCVQGLVSPCWKTVIPSVGVVERRYSNAISHKTTIADHKCGGRHLQQLYFVGCIPPSLAYLCNVLLWYSVVECYGVLESAVPGQGTC